MRKIIERIKKKEDKSCKSMLYLGHKVFNDNII